jgi:hypothetical protein
MLELILSFLPEEPGRHLNSLLPAPSLSFILYLLLEKEPDSDLDPPDYLDLDRDRSFRCLDLLLFFLSLCL